MSILNKTSYTHWKLTEARTEYWRRARNHFLYVKMIIVPVLAQNARLSIYVTNELCFSIHLKDCTHLHAEDTTL